MSNDLSARHPRLAELFGIDLRSLALFRITLGLVLLIALLHSFANLSAFYTDAGVLPRAWAIESDSLNRLSLYFLNGQSWFVAALLLVQVISAVMLTLGWRTRAASIVSFVLWASLINRNSLVLNNGDVLMTCLLFWAMFLPLAARYSVDAATSSNPAPADAQHLSWSSAGLLLQIAAVPFFGALLKSGIEWEPQFTAAYYALSVDRYALSLGQMLLDFPDLLHTLSAGVWWLGLLGPIFIFTPILNRYIRPLLALCFVLMNFGIALCLNLDVLPFASMAAWTVFLGGWIWDALSKRRQRLEVPAPRIYYDRDCSFCQKSVLLIQQFLMLPRAIIAPAQDNARAKSLLTANNSWVVIDSSEQAHMKWQAFVVLLKHSPLLGWLAPLLGAQALVGPGNAAYDWIGRHRSQFSSLSNTLMPAREVRHEISNCWQRFAAVCLVAVLCWNLSTVNAAPQFLASVLAPPLRMLRLDQRWDLFAPSPQKEDGWLVIPAQLADGAEVDLLDPEHGMPDYSKAAHLRHAQTNTAWNNFLSHLWAADGARHRQYYSQYLCREWNNSQSSSSEKRVLTLKMVYMLEHTAPPGEAAQIEQVVLSRHECFPQEAKGQVP